MTTRLTVALVGDPRNPGARLGMEEWAKAWDERPHVELEVADNETLASILDRAWTSLGIAKHEFGLGRWTAGDLGIYKDNERAKATPLTVTDNRGTVAWNAWDLRLISYGQLVCSIDAEAIEGDPTRLYLILREPIGNGVGIDWPAVLQAWELAWSVADRLATAGGAAYAGKEIYQRVQARLERGRRAASTHGPRLAQEGAWPNQVASFRSRHLGRGPGGAADGGPTG